MSAQQILDTLASRCDETTLALVRDALANSERIAIIRDMFLKGRDAEAIEEIRGLAPDGLYKYLPISSSPMMILPLQSAQITARPLVPFRATRLLVSSYSRDFMITSMRVGMQHQTLQSGDIPSDLFVGDLETIERPIQGELIDGIWTVRIDRRVIQRVGLPISFPECPVGQEIVITVVYVGEAYEGREFRGALLGFTRHH